MYGSRLEVTSEPPSGTSLRETTEPFLEKTEFMRVRKEPCDETDMRAKDIRPAGKPSEEEEELEEEEVERSI